MVAKKITFIYTDPVQKMVGELIAEQARERGYETELTDNVFARCEIGWYCDHINFPQYSKFSVIMLHDITQQYGNWPDIWMREPWNKYDIGFLPSKVWKDNWDKCSQYFYANPRHGMYLAGWPKADHLSQYTDKDLKDEYAAMYGLDFSKPTILYAPAWENDNKQTEFIEAMMTLDVNILVKQPPWGPSYVEQLANIKEMYELHKDNKRVVQIDPKVSILDVITVSDILVSEESSTMCESVMLGKPAISVTDWPIPFEGTQYPADDYDYVVKTKKKDLAKCVQYILDNYDRYQKEAQTYSDEHFSNIGKCIPIMLDVLDKELCGKDSPLAIAARLEPAPRQKLSFSHYMKHRKYCAKMEFIRNYSINNPICRALYRCYKAIKK